MEITAYPCSACGYDKYKWEKRAAAMEESGKDLQSLGCGLILLITVPVLLIVFFIGSC